MDARGPAAAAPGHAVVRAVVLRVPGSHWPLVADRPRSLVRAGLIFLFLSRSARKYGVASGHRSFETGPLPGDRGQMQVSPDTTVSPGAGTAPAETPWAQGSCVSRVIRPVRSTLEPSVRQEKVRPEAGPLASPVCCRQCTVFMSQCPHATASHHCKNLCSRKFRAVLSSAHSRPHCHLTGGWVWGGCSHRGHRHSWTRAATPLLSLEGCVDFTSILRHLAALGLKSGVCGC